jgi:iron complex outermembrane receptor protein
MKRNPMLAAAITLLATPLPAAGQSSATTSTEEVVVTESRLDDPARSEVDPDAPHRSPAADGGDLLRSEPGVWGSRFGGHGIDPVIRGQKAGRLNVLLDGGYVYGGCPNRMDPASSYAAPETYDRVEVIRGSQTVRYGSGGSGGTVRFLRETPRFAPGEHLRGKIGGGLRSNSNTSEVFADVTAGNESGYTRLLGSHKNAHDYTDGAGDEVRSGFTSRDAQALVGWTPDADTRLELGAGTTQGEDIKYVGMMDAPETTNDSYRLSLDREASTLGFDSTEARLYYNDVHHVMDNYSLPGRDPMMRMRVPSDSITYGGRASGDLALAGGEWTLGVDYRFNNRDAIRYSDMMSTKVDYEQSYMWPDADLGRAGVFIEGDQPVGAGELRLGVRVDRVTADANASDTNQLATSPDDLYGQYYAGVDEGDEATETNVGGVLRYRRPVGPVTVFTGLSRSVRTADATERYMASNATSMMSNWVGNPEINPEQHNQLEVGLDAGGQAWSAQASAYYNRVTDYILSDTARGQDGILKEDGANIYRNVDAYLAGAEVSLERVWAGHWRASLQGSYVYAQNTTDDSPLPQTPPLTGELETAYQAEAWSLGARVKAATKQQRDAPETGLDTGETPAYQVADLFAAWRPTPALEVKAGVDNLFDQAYRTHLNRVDSTTGDGLPITEPGRSAWMRVTGRF